MLGEILKQRREELGLGVQDIARMTGMPPKQVVALEAGHAAYFAGGKLEVDRLRTSDITLLFGDPVTAGVALDCGGVNFVEVDEDEEALG